MKNLIIAVLSLSIILAAVSCASQRGVQFVNLSTKEPCSETELILTTTYPVLDKETKLESPLCLIPSFAEDKIFSSENEEIIINKGPIRIKS